MAVADGVGAQGDEPVVRVAVAACFLTLGGDAAVLVFVGLGVAVGTTGTATNACRKDRSRATSRARRWYQRFAKRISFSFPYTDAYCLPPITPLWPSRPSSQAQVVWLTFSEWWKHTLVQRFKWKKRYVNQDDNNVIYEQISLYYSLTYDDASMRTSWLTTHGIPRIAAPQSERPSLHPLTRHPRKCYVPGTSWC